MLTTDKTILDAYKSPVRHINAEIVVYDGETVKTRFYDDTVIQSITLERTSETNKFFGFGISHKANIKILDTERNIDIKAGNSLTIDVMSGGNALRIAPRLCITQIHRDEITNQLSITAYDKLKDAATQTVSTIEMVFPATIADYATQAAAALGLGVIYNADNAAFSVSYETGANLDGAETQRQLLDAIAEATQTVYYINRFDTLVFKALDRDGEAAYIIDKEQYINLDSGENRRLAAICHTTELGDSITAKLEVSGTTQYVRDNPFYEMREDTHTLIDAALLAIGGITINQYECDWRGCPAIEIGDKLAIVRKDGTTAITYLLDDTLTYDGTLSQRSQWRYEDGEAETAENPTNLGEALYKTFARVDKVNKQIDIVASETDTNANNIAAIQLKTESLLASVSKMEENVNTTIEGVNGEISTLTQKVEAAMTADAVKLSIQEELANGVDKVYTSTGFAFDADGLRVSKTGSEMETLLDEDGLSVFRDDVEVLTADNVGVNCINVNIRQYLMIGDSRFEAYGAGRTGCFWIGG